MSEVELKQKSNTSFVDSIKDLCKVGLYLDALTKAENQWGPIKSWESREQIYIAIRLYINLGGDRVSDAILLKFWRRDKTCPNLLNKILYYKLNNLGPILANDFVKENEHHILKDKSFETELLGFKSIIQKIFKNYSQADYLLDKAISVDPADNWLTSLKIQLLHEQDESIEAKLQAKKHFDAYPSPHNMRVLSTILRKTDGADRSIALYKKHVEQYQSASVWFEYASLLAGIHDWIECEKAISKFEQVRIIEDKQDNKTLTVWKAQIAIHKQEIEQALKLLSTQNSGYWNIVCENLKQSEGKLDRKILDVPFLKQEHMTCAPTTIAALCKFWGDEYDSHEIADKICFDGTPDTKERQWLRDHNYAFKEFELEAELAYALIDNDIPFALVTTAGFSSHIQAVIGYNRQIGTIYIMDPSNAVMQEMLTKETIEYEAYSGARCIAFVPDNKSELLTKFNFPASELFPIWDEFSCAEEKSDYASAKNALDKLITIDPNHRITLRVKRNFSIWNNDTNTILESNNRLLERFPDQTLLLNSKYVCYRDLARREEGISLLNKYLVKNINLDLLGTLFDEIYDTNDHNDIKARAVEQIKRYGGYSAYSHWSLANFYWIHQSFELATEHYLYAYCLDETSSRYIESYFKACRHTDKTEEALGFLKLRFNKYKVRSHLPAVSLHQAYDLLGKEHIGIEYLFKALKFHQNDANLLSYLSKQLIDNGMIEEFESIKEQVKSRLDSSEFDELVARKNEKIGNFEAALEYYQNSFRQKPFIQNYANGCFRLLHKRGDTKQIDNILENLYKDHDDSTQILDYIADWHSDTVFREKVLTSFVNVRPDYGAIRRQLVDVRIMLGNFEQALDLAIDTCDKIVGEHINTSYLANCYLKIGNFNEARSLAKTVLLKSIDSEIAFNVLMNASQTKEEKQSSLRFIFVEIQKQVIFGDSAWHYWFAAKSTLPVAELKEFIDYLLNNYQHLWYTYSLAANFYKQCDDLEKSLSQLQLGINKFPLNPRLYNDIGQLYELKGNIPETIKAYEHALTINPAWADVTKRLSDIFEKHESFDFAIEVVNNGIKHNPDDGVLHGYLADLLIKKGSNTEAVEALKASVKNSTDYRWAWNQLVNLCNSTEQQHTPNQLATELSKQAPYHPHVWRDLAYVTEEREKKLSLFDKSLECDRYYIPVYQDKAQYFASKGEYKEALAFLDNTPWKKELPNQLAIQKIDLLIDIGQKKLAIVSLKSILFNFHGYAHLWSKLFSLLEEEGDKEAYLDCCHKSVDQNKHDPDVLCYAGENLFKHGNEKDKAVAKSYLKKAFSLSPNDQYIVMTYIDCLVEGADYEEALKSIEAYEKFKKVCYGDARKINVLCKLERFDEALVYHKQLILDEDADYWCLDFSFKALNEKYSFEELESEYSENINSLTRVQAYFHTDICLIAIKNKKYKPVLQQIDKYQDGEQWIGGFLALLEYWNDNDIIPPDEVIDKYLKRIVKVPTLIEQLGGAYINAGHYHSMIKLFENTNIQDELPAFVFYHYRLALQMLGRWDDASEIIIKGLQQQPDNTIHNLRLWYAYELIRTNQELTQADLEVIDYSELIEMEQYVYSTLLVLLELGNNSLEIKLDELSPLLRKCQQDYQKAGGQELALHARNTLKTKLKNSIKAKGFWSSLKLAWWISNRF